MKVALVHYWLVGMRGGEKVLETFCDIFPNADIFTLVADPEKLSAKLKRHKLTTSFLQNIGGRKHYQKMLPLMPHALESLDLTAYDLVISSEAGPAKGVITRPDAVHVCYCHSPMRYIWDLYPQYMAGSSRLARAVLALTAPILRQWDVTTSHRVDHFVTNSEYVAKRVMKFYRRQATVIHPPVDVARFQITPGSKDYYLCAGQITPYKKIELAVAACTKMNLPLVVVGDGASTRLKQIAGPTVHFIGAVSDAEMESYLAGCRALLYPGVEDFGIVPLEAMACGRPVIAFGRGGALETVVEGTTGLFFHEQTVEALMVALTTFEKEQDRFSPAEIRAHAMRFVPSRFEAELRQFLGGVTGSLTETTRRKMSEEEMRDVRIDLVPQREEALVD
ncbi:glycosyltransferase involved in cell wall biosynthesis [Pseudorhizobium tarimense]|uniref:Glycosyltransferase involved in cell wall biosynthesis n=1 Tax=Pseudorhizobium tarimense TaxID=1079109 RepID=A0ABV2HBF0_9HYPH|nr:glycosyltransferase [Pseudorhizobium tarimense]MCJ8520960.1 glycosyltransferase [Pseudorhizobium tarimense]